MSQTWYPVIDYSLCTECGACFRKCSHEVYKLEEKRVVVDNPDGCVHECTGCGKLCPTSAIDYVGSNAGITECGCSCSGKC